MGRYYREVNGSVTDFKGNVLMKPAMLIDSVKGTLIKIGSLIELQGYKNQMLKVGETLRDSLALNNRSKGATLTSEVINEMVDDVIIVDLEEKGLNSNEVADVLNYFWSVSAIPNEVKLLLELKGSELKEKVKEYKI